MHCDYNSFFYDTRWKMGCCTEMCVGVTTVAVESNKKYTNILCVCVCVRARSISYPACSVHAPYCLWPVRIYKIFTHYLTNGTNLEKKLLNKKCVLIFCSAFFWNISDSKQNWARYDHKFHENPSVDAEFFRAGGQTDRQMGTDGYDEASSRFPQFCESA